jgi:hypothetical protein
MAVKKLGIARRGANSLLTLRVQRVGATLAVANSRRFDAPNRGPILASRCTRAVPPVIPGGTSFHGISRIHNDRARNTESRNQR